VRVHVHPILSPATSLPRFLALSLLTSLPSSCLCLHAHSRIHRLLSAETVPARVQAQGEVSPLNLRYLGSTTSGDYNESSITG